MSVALMVLEEAQGDESGLGKIAQIISVIIVSHEISQKRRSYLRDALKDDCRVVPPHHTLTCGYSATPPPTLNHVRSILPDIRV